MTGIVGWFARERDDVSARLSVALGAMTNRGGDATDVVSTDSGAVGATAFLWESESPQQHAARAAALDAWVVVADARLYYLSDLGQRLERETGHRPSPGATPAELILQTYAARGADALEWLEGDFAFLAWNRRSGEVFAARDFAGKRPLYYAEPPGGLAIASTVAGVTALTGNNVGLDLGALAWTTSGLPVLGDRTFAKGVSVLPAGHLLRWRPGRQVEVVPWWSMPPQESSDLDFEEAGLALRELLVGAVAERSGSDLTTVWQSGGMDSSAVTGAGRHNGSGAWRAVSVSYPEGDPGREDEFIADLAAHCDIPVSWVDSSDLPILDWSRELQEPFTHAFQSMIRGLAGASRSAGARVALEGYGGDQLFQVSDIYLADLVRRGRFLTLVREWRHPRWRGAGAAEFLRWSVKPALPGWARASLAAARRSSTRGHLDRVLAPWIRSDLPDLAGRDSLPACERQPGESHGEHEMRWYLTDPYFSAITCAVSQMGLDAGVEVRSPLMDARIVKFAASRPSQERASLGSNKRLLRQALQGLLPESILQQRWPKGGTTEVYFSGTLRRDAGDGVPRLFRRSRLAELGIIEVPIFLRWWEWFAHGGQGAWDVPLLATIQAERWLQQRASVAAPSSARPSLESALT